MQAEFFPRAQSRARRHNRTAAARRQQYQRAQGRAIQQILKTFQEISEHRGGTLTRLGSALQANLAASRDMPPYYEATHMSQAMAGPVNISGSSSMRADAPAFEPNTFLELPQLMPAVRNLDDTIIARLNMLENNILQAVDRMPACVREPITTGVVPVSSVGVNTDDYDSVQPTMATDVGVNTDDYEPSTSYSRGGPQPQTQSAELDAYVIGINAAFAASSSGGNENENKKEDISVQSKVCTNCNGSGWISKFSTCSLCASALKP